MKAWRKHNSSSYVRANKDERRISKRERRTFFNAEMKNPSALILGLIKRVS